MASENNKQTASVGAQPTIPLWYKYPEIAVGTATKAAAQSSAFGSIPAQSGEWIDASTLVRAGQLRSAAHVAIPVVSGLSAATDVLELVNTYREELRSGDPTLIKTCSKIVGTTLSSVFVGSSVYAAAGILASGVSLAGLGAAGIVVVAGGTAAYFSIKYAEQALSGLASLWR